MVESFIVPVTGTKQVRLLKLLHEGSLPLSKVRVKLKDNQPKLVVDSINEFFARLISQVDDNWVRAELKFLVGYGFSGRKENVIWLNDKVEIINFHPDKNNPCEATLRIWRTKTKVRPAHAEKPVGVTPSTS